MFFNIFLAGVSFLIREQIFLTSWVLLVKSAILEEYVNVFLQGAKVFCPSKITPQAEFRSKELLFE